MSPVRLRPPAPPSDSNPRATLPPVGSAKDRHLRTKTRYEEQPKTCNSCDEEIPYEKRTNNYCNRSCAARGTRNRKGTGRHAETPGCRECGAPTRRGQRHGNFNTYCDGCIEEGHHLHRKELHEYDTDKGRKGYLLRHQKRRCEVCRRATWQRHPIPLELDHIDGNADNNERTNLRLICPNCHALTPTYKIRNAGQGSKRQAKRRRRYADGKHTSARVAQSG